MGETLGRWLREATFGTNKRLSGIPLTGGFGDR